MTHSPPQRLAPASGRDAALPARTSLGRESSTHRRRVAGPSSDPSHPRQRPPEIGLPTTPTHQPGALQGGALQGGPLAEVAGAVRIVTDLRQNATPPYPLPGRSAPVGGADPTGAGEIQRAAVLALGVDDREPAVDLLGI